ncbi:MAG TPA: hypothetical protein VFX79_02785 [Candidatus Saccharimonadales bacterium]|nr:hypothetical protein [Candidatus Saccharimonadales bacterium]
MTQLSLPRGYKNAEVLHNNLQSKKEEHWIKSGQKRALRLFHSMARDVPAYKKFLKKQGINTADIKGFKDFSSVPALDKNNYLRAYSRPDLCWEGKFAEQSWVVSTTSGSTGEPYYFPRTDTQDKFLAITTELYLRANFNIQNKSTLYIDAFPMGAWIGGVFTYESIRQVAEKGYPLSIITPGIHRQEVINAVKQLGHEFDQVIIAAYAPHLKDILDQGSEQGVNWKNYNIGLIFSAEAFSETFRDYILKTVGAKNTLRSTLNHYGTVDLGTMAHETPLSILVRRLLVKDDKLSILFPEDKRQPTLAQYDPSLFYFEQEGKNLLCSSYSGIPLFRYDLKDYGGVLTKKEVYKRLRASGYDIDAIIKEKGIESTVWNLPFVYVYERDDFSVSYYAFLIYPDTVRRALQAVEFEKHITGKFTMEVDYDKNGNQRFKIYIEKKPTQEEKTLKDKLKKHIHTQLCEENSEYRVTAEIIGEKFQPHIYLLDNGDPDYFKPGTKQKWVI